MTTTFSNLFLNKIKFSISTPNLEALRLKVYDFYQKFKEENEASQGILIS